MKLQPLTPEHARKAWPVMEPYLRKLADRWPDDWPLESLKAGFADTSIKPWVIWDEEKKFARGVALTELMVKPSGRKVMLIHCSGNNPELWVHLIADLKAYAKDEGVDKIEVIGRRGWVRSLPDFDKEGLVLYSKELSHG